MQKMWIGIGVVVVGLILAGGLAMRGQQSSGYDNYTSTSTSNSMATSSTSTSGASYTLTDIAKHPDASSCWTAINGGVYDLTKWISQHPGGERAILSICGIDGSSAFNGQHGGAARQAQILATFKIGILAQ